MAWYWQTLRRGLPVTFHMDAVEYRAVWWGVYGISIGPVFIGVVKGKVGR